MPLPRNVAGSGLGRSCITRSTTSAPAAAARPASSSSECSGSKWREEPLKRPTSAARSRGSCAPVREDEVRITRRILARGPTPSRRRDAAPDGPRRARRWSTAGRPAPARHRRESRRAAPSAAATSSAVTAGGRPARLALVAVMHAPNAADSARATRCAGTRTPSVPRGASAAAIPRAAGTTIVSGPGQNADASRRSSGPKPSAAACSAIVAPRQSAQSPTPRRAP